MRETWTFHSAGQLLFGRNAVQQLGVVSRRLGIKRLLIVTDPIVARVGLVDRIKAPIEEAGVRVKVFDGGEPEPSIRAAEASIDAAEVFQAEGILGLGGGSNMDLAKITATVLAHAGGPRDFFGDDRIPGPIWPLICVPTTAGTGSEVSAAAVLTETETQMKVGILSNYLRPQVAVVDPLLTVSCPPKVTADTGIDALTHAIEAYTAVDNADFPLPPGERSVYQGRHPMGDCLAEKAISLIGTFLRRAVATGEDLEARDGMALGATLAGLAFSNVGVALVHAMEYPVGGAVHCSHGAGNGLLLPSVMRFNLPARRKEFAAIGRLLGEDLQGLDPDTAAERGVQAVEKLRTDIGIPQRLRDIGVRKEQLRPFAEKACSIRRILRVNPRPVTPEEVEGIYETAF
ncbi:MAG: iron-containing alcohol dehydrogenase [Gemmataceae bacterium]|nr:iron-containing alcohol dehydrogenase [Gemmataceae bacterium]